MGMASVPLNNNTTFRLRKEYRIVRTVKEVFYLKATTREEALKIIGEEGCTPAEIILVKETVRHINKY